MRKWNIVFSKRRRKKLKAEQDVAQNQLFEKFVALQLNQVKEISTKKKFSLFSSTTKFEI